MIEVIIAVLNFILYRETLQYGLVMDDHQIYAKRKRDGFLPINKIKNFHDFRGWFDEHFYTGTTFGTDEKLEHKVTLSLHIIICSLIYLVLGHNQISFWASILYSCNPINNQTSIWLNGRRYALNIILVLLMLAVPQLSPILYLTTGLLQVTAFFSPILLINHSLWYLVLVPIFLTIGWRQIKGKCDSRSIQMADGDLKTWKWTRLIVIVKTFGFFFWKMLIPQVCAMQYPDRIKWGLTKEGTKEAYEINRDFLKGCGAIFSTIFLFIIMPNNYKPFVVFMGLSILQWSAVLPITQILSDRYCSLPNVFMMFILPYTIITYSNLLGVIGSYIGIFLLLAITCYYCICLSIVIPMYKDFTSWYQYHFNYFPALSWYRHNLIQDLMNEGKRDMASQQTYEGLLHDPKDYRLLRWGCIMSMLKGDSKKAEIFLNEAEKNFYINKEEEQAKDIAHLRKQIEFLKNLEKKASTMTSREKAILLRKKRISP